MPLARLAYWGKLEAISTGAATRLPESPSVPTVSEAGVRGDEAAWWYGYVVQANMPKDVLDKLSAAIHAGLEKADSHDTLTKAGLVIVGSSLLNSLRSLSRR